MPRSTAPSRLAAAAMLRRAFYGPILARPPVQAIRSYHSGKSERVTNENEQELTNLLALIMVTFLIEATRR